MPPEHVPVKSIAMKIVGGIAGVAFSVIAVAYVYWYLHIKDVYNKLGTQPQEETQRGQGKERFPQEISNILPPPLATETAYKKVLQSLPPPSEKQPMQSATALKKLSDSLPPPPDN